MGAENLREIIAYEIEKHRRVSGSAEYDGDKLTRLRITCDCGWTVTRPDHSADDEYTAHVAEMIEARLGIERTGAAVDWGGGLLLVDHDSSTPPDSFRSLYRVRALEDSP